MRKKRLVLFVFFVVVVFYFSCSNSGDGDLKSTSPENLSRAFSAAVKSGDEAKAETFCTKEFWNEKRDSGKRFFKQAVRRKFELKTGDVQAREKRAVVSVDIEREGKVVDQVYFYAVETDDQWLFDGMDENRNHAGYYLDGGLPARFYPSDYPGSPELEALGTKLIEIAGPLQEASADTEKQASLLKGVLVGDAGKIYSELGLLLKVSNMKLNVVSTHMVASIGRGAIVIHDESGREKVFIYVARETEGWRLLNCYTGWLDGEALLR
jgi:hypothetical protein